MMKKRMRAIIVDDERLAREELKSMLKRHESIEVVGEARTAKQAAEKIGSTDPDVIFLDIQMPGKSGFDLLEMIDSDAHVIFVTAYDEYAIRAFEINALDYLLKPVESERLAQSIERLAGGSPEPDTRREKLRLSDSLYVRAGNHAAFLQIARIVCITAAGDYSEARTDGGKRLLVSKSIHEWELCLPAQYFHRIHRSTIINIEKVDHIVDRPNTTSDVFMTDLEQPLRMSRRRKSMLRKRLK